MPKWRLFAGRRRWPSRWDRYFRAQRKRRRQTPALVIEPEVLGRCQDAWAAFHRQPSRPPFWFHHRKIFAWSREIYGEPYRRRDVRDVDVPPRRPDHRFPARLLYQGNWKTMLGFNVDWKTTRFNAINVERNLKLISILHNIFQPR